MLPIKGGKPTPRSRHTTLCIEDPTAGHHSLLMIGGRGGRRSVFSDVWLLDWINRVWTEVCLRVKFTFYVHLHVVLCTLSL